MPTTMLDTRPVVSLTPAQADELFRQIAMLTHKANKISADYEKKIGELKVKADNELAPIRSNISQLAKKLSDYISVHKERFNSPRQRKTEYGTYGLRSVANLELTDPDAALAAVKEQHIPALVVTEKLDKKAVAKALADGAVIPGAEMRRGEIASYTVSKDLEEGNR